MSILSGCLGGSEEANVEYVGERYDSEFLVDVIEAYVPEGEADHAHINLVVGVEFSIELRVEAGNASMRFMPRHEFDTYFLNSDNRSARGVRMRQSSSGSGSGVSTQYGGVTRANNNEFTVDISNIDVGSFTPDGTVEAEVLFYQG